MWNDTDIPLAYLITFRCYGTWLHGDERGSIDRCEFRKWHSRAISIRTNHAHAVVSIGAKKPEIALNAFKSNATREMRLKGCWLKPTSPWVDKGSYRYLWNEMSVLRAIDYVLNGQGDELPDFD